MKQGEIYHKVEAKSGRYIVVLNRRPTIPEFPPAIDYNSEFRELYHCIFKLASTGNRNTAKPLSNNRTNMMNIIQPFQDDLERISDRVMNFAEPVLKLYKRYKNRVSSEMRIVKGSPRSPASGARRERSFIKTRETILEALYTIPEIDYTYLAVFSAIKSTILSWNEDFSFLKATVRDIVGKNNELDSSSCLSTHCHYSTPRNSQTTAHDACLTSPLPVSAPSSPRNEDQPEASDQREKSVEVGQKDMEDKWSVATFNSDGNFCDPALTQRPILKAESASDLRKYKAAEIRKAVLLNWGMDENYRPLDGQGKQSYNNHPLSLWNALGLAEPSPHRSPLAGLSNKFARLDAVGKCNTWWQKQGIIMGYKCLDIAPEDLDEFYPHFFETLEGLEDMIANILQTCELVERLASGKECMWREWLDWAVMNA